QDLVAGLNADDEHLPGGEEGPRPFGVVAWPELERGPEVALRGAVGVECLCPLARVPERESRRGLQLVERLAGGTSEIERGEIVVREQLGLVVGPSQFLDPFGCEAVLVGAAAARDLAVGDVTDEQVAE